MWMGSYGASCLDLTFLHGKISTQAVEPRADHRVFIHRRPETKSHIQQLQVHQRVVPPASAGQAMV